MKSATGEEMPGGVGRLEAYRWTPPSTTGVVSDVPLGDFCSHTADALRTFAEADARHLIKAAQSGGWEAPRTVVKKAGAWA